MLNQDALSKIEEIIKQAGLESSLSIDALKSVVKLKEDYTLAEDRIKKLELNVEEKMTEISNLGQTIRDLETKNKKLRDRDLEVEKQATKNREDLLKIEEEQFKLKFYEARGNEMKEILGMALRNTEFRKTLQFSNGSNISTYSNNGNMSTSTQENIYKTEERVEKQE